jgi:hypothetical protein
MKTDSITYWFEKKIGRELDGSRRSNMSRKIKEKVHIGM